MLGPGEISTGQDWAPVALDNLALAKQLASKINIKALEEDGSIFQKFGEELEINDFPWQARWKVTSKEAPAQISVYCEACITVIGRDSFNSYILSSIIFII